MARSRNTDVPASLAGYYYQLLLAAKELSRLLIIEGVQDHDGVGIEKGADIRVFFGNGTSIEAKFYSNKHFTRNHTSIRHTIYNFYLDFMKQDPAGLPTRKYVYSTNVPLHPDDHSFFDSWPRSGTGHESIYATYIRDCIVQESVLSDGRSKENYKTFKAGLADQDLKEWQYVEKLLHHLQHCPSDYAKYGYSATHEQLERFLKHIQFHFSAKWVPKCETISSIISDIQASLQAYNSSLQPTDCRQIALHLVDALFATTVKTDFPYVRIRHAKEIIAHHKEHLRNYLLEEKLKEAMEAIEEEIEMLEDFLAHHYKGTRGAEILETFLQFIELFYEELEQSEKTIDEFIQTYCLSQHGNTVKNVTSLFRPMSILSVYMNLNAKEVKLAGLPGIENFKFDGWESLCLKDASGCYHRDQVIRKFIVHSLDQAAKIDARKPIVLHTPHRPCALEKKALEGIVMNITQVEENERYFHLYSSLTYRCTFCLREQDSDSCMLEDVLHFVKGVCS
ncbi:hypothetical protein [Paenibacillus ehimensis]|uniref:Restriction endonuclease n=1 Tax=Paenibacillus ehimensis TaxID=79264 RepID=A0ABT8VFI0_9BACL|nr:hypothetical protein [Paenibacillus ehimensis]MDO3679732.1 hypothetical protein [Paenibacillus ehimensis]